MKFYNKNFEPGDVVTINGKGGRFKATIVRFKIDGRGTLYAEATDQTKKHLNIIFRKNKKKS